jgi:hypothetical protein
VATAPDNSRQLGCVPVNHLMQFDPATQSSAQRLQQKTEVNSPLSAEGNGNPQPVQGVMYCTRIRNLPAQFANIRCGRESPVISNGGAILGWRGEMMVPKVGFTD